MATRRAPAQKKSERTRQTILDAALRLFRRRGFDATTMRQIAEAAGLSLGAAYYYFESKDDILFAYYARNRDQHEARASERMAGATDLRGRLGAVLHASLDVIADERELLGALLGRLTDPRDPISALSAAQADVRARSIALFAAALGDDVPADVRRLAAPGLWLGMMGVLFYYVRDDSPEQARTRRLIEDGLDLVAPLLVLAGTPLAAPLLAQLEGTLARAGLLPG